MFGLGTKEIVIIAIVLVVLFGASRIPVLAKDVSTAVKSLGGIFKNDKTDKK